MSTDDAKRQLILPALRANMGDWIYYITFMRMADIADRVNVAEEIHSSKSLNELIQRQLSNRAIPIKEYLQNQPQRFFNSLVLATYMGTPKWFELAIQENNMIDIGELPNYLNGSLGMLVLSGEEKIFALDGQHRVVGIRKAVDENQDIGIEEVSAIFVAHKNDNEGLKRTRRLFTTLNRYAKAVSKQEAIALDEDDVVAIVTRFLVERHPLFQEKISLARGKNIPSRDDKSLTTIVALYDTLDLYLQNLHRGWNNYKKIRPNDDTIEDFYQRAVNLWDLMINYFPPLEEVKDSVPDDKIAASYRNRNGGHLLFRPIGLMLCIKVIRKLVDFEFSIEESIRRISSVPMDIAQEPWVGLLWDNTNHRMITSSVNQNVGMKLLYFSVGGDLARLRKEENEYTLRREYAGLLNKEIDEVTLVNYVQ